MDREEIKERVKMHAIQTRRQLLNVKSDNLRYRVVCAGINPEFVASQGQNWETSKECGPIHEESSQHGGTTKVGESSKVSGGSKEVKKKPKKKHPKPTCPWVLHISRKSIENQWCVKTFNEEHNCLTTRKVKLYTVSSIAREIEDVIEVSPNIPLKALQDQLQKKHQVEISLQKVFRAKTMASQKIQGDYIAQYGLLRDYCDEVIRSNPGTTIKIQVESEPNPGKLTRQFKRIYICYAAVKAGFKLGGRDLLGLDGTFMKGPYPGQILTAVGVDANNGIYPVAFAIVESESFNSWSWFLECLGEDLDLTSNSNFTFISDRQKGIIPAIQKVFPAAEHRFCLRHIHENMKSTWRGDMYKNLLWKAASATSIPFF
ncbi:putative transposase, mutator type, MULE transposase domain-containing protein [Helianthus debilis subsp. tardiflorus]